MSKFKKILLSFLFIATASTGTVLAQEVKNGLTWYNDIEKAYDVSHQNKKPIFAFFTGSDWCGWCHRLEANVFDKAGFKKWAKENVVLLELDFPRGKQLPQKMIEQNNGLQQFFNVQGYPTIWVFNMEKDDKSQKINIAALGSLQYPQAAPGKEEEVFLANANAILKNK
ncbi:MAG: thioredoxin family protein [Chitinophagaceae bacterium]